MGTMPRPFAWAMSLRVELRCDIGVTVYKIMRNCLFMSAAHAVYEGADGTGWSTLSAFYLSEQRPHAAIPGSLTDSRKNETPSRT